METFNKLESFVMQGKHKLAPPTFTFDDFGIDDDADKDAIAALGLGTSDNIYRVCIGNYKATAVFKRWWGVHALFYSPANDITLAVVVHDLPKLVKVIES